jgi:hypothetical protein
VIEEQIRNDEKKRNSKLIEEMYCELDEKNKKIQELEETIKAAQKIR